MKKVIILVIVAAVLLMACSKGINKFPDTPPSPVGLASSFIESGIAVSRPDGAAIGTNERIIGGDRLKVTVEPQDDNIRAVYRLMYFSDVNEGLGNYQQNSKVDNNFPIASQYADTFTFMVPSTADNSVEGILAIPDNAETGNYLMAVAGLTYDIEAGQYVADWDFFMKRLQIYHKDYCPTVNNKRCNDNILQTCSQVNIATKWQNVETCTYGCYPESAASAKCRECSPGVQCEGDNLYTCTADGFKPAQSAWQNCGAGKCINRQCTECAPNEVQCRQSQYRFVCSAAGSYPTTETEDCGAGKCINNQCSVCAPNEVKCEQNQYRFVCNAAGSYPTTAAQDCGAGKCINGACKECVPGTKQCVPNEPKLKTCNAQGDWTITSCSFGCIPPGVCVGYSGTPT